jgi:hypothetical protein
VIGLDALALVCRLQRPQVGEMPFITEGRRRMMRLAARVDSKNEHFGIPSPAYWEFLVDLTNSEQAEVAAALMSRKFRILPVDGPAGNRIAQLWRTLAGMCAIRRTCDEIGYTRQMFKIDLQIIGCCLYHGARMIITGDKGVREVCARVNLPCYFAWEIPESEMTPAAQGEDHRWQIPETEDDRDEDEEA